MVRPGVLATTTVWWPRFSPDQRNVNWTTSDRLADLGGGSTFYTNLVTVEPASSGQLKLPTAQAEGFLVCLHSPYPAIGPRARSARLASRRTSRVEDIRASERNARLSSVVTLACDLRPFPNAATRGSQAREERSGMHLIDTVVLLPARPIYRGTRKHYLVVKCTMYTFLEREQKVEMLLPLDGGRLSIPRSENRGLSPQSNVSTI